MNNSGHQPPNITCESKLEVIKQRIVWKIDNYSIRSKQKGECWFSDDFEFNGINGVTTNWELCLYPLGARIMKFKSIIREGLKKKQELLL